MLGCVCIPGYMMDPHTAVARSVACRMGNPDVPTIITGTAHFAKFIDNILPFFHLGANDYSSHSVVQLMQEAECLARLPRVHPQLELMVNKPVIHHDCLPADYDNITKAIVEFASQL